MPGRREEAVVAQAVTPAQVAQARELFLEYAAWLKVDLCFQGFDKELASLPGNYALPNGRLLLAEADGALAGCIALRPFAPGVGEVKRLYVRPAFRGRGIAKQLTAQLLAAARAIGYASLRLDTLEIMHEAAKLYRSLGFLETAPYYHNPLQGVVYMELKLSPAGVSPGESPATGTSLGE
jgi:putative acetyltransferase